MAPGRCLAAALGLEGLPLLGWLTCLCLDWGVAPEVGVQAYFRVWASKRKR